MTRAPILTLVALVAGCGESITFPAKGLGVELRITAVPTVVAVGDSVTFTASAYNPTNEEVQIGQQCGPSFDVLVTTPTGAEVSVLTESLGGHVFFTCQLGPWHIVEPGETETMILEWRAPAPGVYAARATLRREERYLSAAAQVTVR